MTDLLSPSCFPGMFPFTFLDSFLIKAFSAFSLFLSSNLSSMFSRNVPERPISSLPCSFMASFFAFIECVTTEVGNIPGNFSETSLFSHHLQDSQLLLDQPLLSHLLSHFQVSMISLIQVMKVSYLLQCCHLLNWT